MHKQTPNYTGVHEVYKALKKGVQEVNKSVLPKILYLRSTSVSSQVFEDLLIT